MSIEKRLRSGYTTGACAAAAAKAAALMLLGGQKTISSVEILFPDGSRHKFRIQNSKFKIQDKTAFASVIKDAGDDPDITNGAEIIAEVRLTKQHKQVGDCPRFTGAAPVFDGAGSESGLSPTSAMIIKGGTGVGIATKPGLPVPVGEAAINPVPRKMIKEAVMEALQQSAICNPQVGDCPRFTGAAPVFDGAGSESGLSPTSAIEITISVVDGENLAKKTLNARLGIIGGISILGTTGIVRPISSEAWTATITSSMDVARAMGHDEIVLSAGRASELSHIKRYKLPEECYVMMGDYLEFSLLEAKRHGFRKIHLCAQWAKMLKIAMTTPQTHVRYGALDTKKAVWFLNTLGINVPQGLQFNTAREVFDFIQSAFSVQQSAIFSKVCSAARKYAESITSGLPVIAHLVSYEGEIVTSSE
ncbi:cobalt-precorrin-5B (C(1))-methyltransferase CbiD [Dissulfurispira sp.]|uniref:cobalt-precorrin-5B (C(1))-methyltransferase CbiD n=1 Tax=Dissulfurispira sp. TaxID=2817609 RepID=UPI002FDAC15D